MERKGYSGWTNYETWLVNLWLTNDEGIYNSMLELAASCADECGAAEAIKDCIEECNPLNDTATLFTDLMNATLSEVNWHEIAKSLRETAGEHERHKGAK